MRKLAMVVLLSALLGPSAAHATFPGANGRIAFERGGDIWTMNPDGTGQVNLTNDAATQRNPAWSADGNRIAFDQAAKTWWMLADGSNRVLADDGSVPASRLQPAWSPNGSRIMFTHGAGLWTMNPDGTGVAGITSGYEWLDWSIGNQFAYGWVSPDCKLINDLYVSNTTGTSVQRLTDNTGGTGFECLMTLFGLSWSPDGQRIAYYNVDYFCDGHPGCNGNLGFFTIKPDGTDREQLPNGGPLPAWSPDGTKIAFGDGTIQVMNANGTGVTPITSGMAPTWQPIPTASPAADVLATLTDAPDPVRAGDELHYTASAKNLVGPDPATGVTLTLNLPASVFFVSATPSQGSCSFASGTVTCNFGTLPVGATASVDVKVEPRPVIADTQITVMANVSASQADPVPGNNSASATTTVRPGAHVRPKGATPLRASLVPSYRQCGSEATLQHGAPLSFPSCGNPQLSSGYLTFGTPDANGRGANSVGYVLYSVVGESPIDPNNGDQADVNIKFSLSDVRNKDTNLTDYTGELVVTSQLRITDRDNGAGGFTSATAQDIPFPVFAQCAATVATTVGSTCTAQTSADAVVPGSVKESKRSVWQLGQIQVTDGGPDGLAVTSDNTLLAVQGVFVP